MVSRDEFPAPVDRGTGELNHMLAVIIGAGRVGMDLIELLLPEGYDISVIEVDRTRADEMSEKFDILVIHGDATDLAILRDAMIESADVLIAVTGDDNVNLVASQLTQKVFKVKKIIARVNNPRNEAIFTQLGINNTVSTTRSSAMFIKNEIGDIKTVFAGGNLVGLQVTVSKGSFVSDKQVMEIDFPRDCLVMTIDRRGEGTVLPEGRTRFLPQDRVTLLIHKDREREVKELFLEKGKLSKIKNFLAKK